MATLGADGHVVLPREILAALGVGPGDTLVMLLEPDGLRLLTPAQAVARAQVLVRQYVAAYRSLADELIAERREGRDVA
jgi:bifunctional DNA-binding transcriptional regulator/antitoxin component of YhaV-PrlF toxin-antitoxin module